MKGYFLLVQFVYKVMNIKDRIKIEFYSITIVHFYLYFVNIEKFESFIKT
jgi:hypothetical protein